MEQPKPLNLRPLAPYEDRLLSALAFFRTKRKVNNQAHHCLSMYLRQSESRILSELGFYAHLCNMDKLDFLELIYNDPHQAEAMIQEASGTKISEVFEEE